MFLSVRHLISRCHYNFLLCRHDSGGTWTINESALPLPRQQPADRSKIILLWANLNEDMPIHSHISPIVCTCAVLDLPLCLGTIPEKLWQLKELEVMNLSSNNFINITPGQFEGLSSLTHLYIWNNTFTCTDAGRLPSKLRCYDDCADVRYNEIDTWTKRYMEYYGISDPCEM